MKYNFSIWALTIFMFLSVLTIILEYFETIDNEGFTGLFYLLIMPGLILYVIVTGDIHGWQPGPIGVIGRLIVTILGSSIFWTLLAYLIFRRRKRKLNR